MEFNSQLYGCISRCLHPISNQKFYKLSYHLQFQNLILSDATSMLQMKMKKYFEFEILLQDLKLYHFKIVYSTVKSKFMIYQLIQVYTISRSSTAKRQT
ncbi:UNKNOWN [Stylonychia lemnae]|uniref:Uncharacterized protein n=1 Tax=Stylonychia lemnae TaxID=5949 RepID=A0A078AN30_STYLE|nr:UNKNOWN [Stylonychia lemnae]|eukprot:CDW83336.1 UNKNOWN [Stylonychia lemnae]